MQGGGDGAPPNLSNIMNEIGKVMCPGNSTQMLGLAQQLMMPPGVGGGSSTAAAVQDELLQRQQPKKKKMGPSKRGRDH